LQLVSDYLVQEGHDPTLGQELFAGIVDRVVALVSRIEGTFEFEVQPMREYFAARHLFNTAPLSSPGKERSGARPDRFDAIARNFYWLNVTRFYAGFYSKGELPSLVERLQDLSQQDGFKHISYPKSLATMLLSDWVFAQNPRSVQQVVDLVLDGIGIRLLTNHASPRRRLGLTELPAIPSRCGREEIVRRSFDMLRCPLARDFATEVVGLLRAYSAGSDLSQHWLTCCETANSVSESAKWLEYGLQLGVLPTINAELLARVIPQSLTSEVLDVLYRARRLDFLERNEATFNTVIAGILDKRIGIAQQRRVESALDALNHAVDPLRYVLAFDQRSPVPLARTLEHRNRSAKLSWSPRISTETEFYSAHRACVGIATAAEIETAKPTAVWATELEPWDRIVEVGRSFFGEQ
jgi:hypothetical protein